MAGSPRQVRFLEIATCRSSWPACLIEPSRRIDHHYPIRFLAAIKNHFVIVGIPRAPVMGHDHRLLTSGPILQLNHSPSTDHQLVTDSDQCGEQELSMATSTTGGKIKN